VVNTQNIMNVPRRRNAGRNVSNAAAHDGGKIVEIRLTASTRTVARATTACCSTSLSDLIVVPSP